jgi:peptide-methionine (S)-S-oxide reductase
MKTRESFESAARRKWLKSRAVVQLGAALLVAGACMLVSQGAGAESATKLPPPLLDTAPSAAGGLQTVVFGGGCFWGVQAVFQHTRGVVQAVSGYAGGGRETATYESVSSGATGHAESVQVTFDSRQVTFGKLLQIYFSVAHDPTQLNRQGPDTGSQYRSALFYTDASQRQLAERYIAQLDGAHVFPAKIVTQLIALSGFYPAEAYHQNYATLHPDAGYIAMFDRPKIASLKDLFPDVYQDLPVLVATRMNGQAK